MKIAALLLALCLILQMPGALLHAENIPESELRYTGIDDKGLEAEAERLGIPSGDMNNYVNIMRDMNNDYQAGSLTWTEYVMQKRRYIEGLK